MRGPRFRSMPTAAGLAVLLLAGSCTALAALLLAGCGDDDSPITPPGQTPADVSGFWMGSYRSTSGDSGNAILDLRQDGAALEGDLVLRQWGSDTHDVLRLLEGAVEDSHITVLRLSASFTLEAEFLAPGRLEGNLTSPFVGVGAGIRLNRMAEGTALVDTSLGLDVGVKSLAWDGEALWLSTTDAFYLVGTFESETLPAVYVALYPNTFWTASALASDGNHFWGDYPVSVSDGTHIRSFSDLIQFTREGVIDRRTSLPHRTGGLAWDGAALWSLGSAGNLYKIDAAGEVIDSLTTGFADLVHLEYGDGFFWSVGWFIRKLYQIDREGRVVSVYDLPRGPGWDFPGGLAFDGTRFYYVSGDVPSLTTVYALSLPASRPRAAPGGRPGEP